MFNFGITTIMNANSTYYHQLNCLYYPFSRLLDGSTLKTLLLLFDTVTFLDEAESAEWRRAMLKAMTQVDGPNFASYERLADDYDLLAQTGAIRIVNPRTLNARKSVGVAIATVADLSDKRFVELATKPTALGLFARSYGLYGGVPTDRPTWQSFASKIALPLLTDNQFADDPIWSNHILIPGDDVFAWTLSYEAGSAAVTNLYLEAAEELSLTPVTTSLLHHELVLRKLKRVFVDNADGVDLIDDLERRRFRAVFGQGEMLRLFGDLFPPHLLDRLTFSQIVEFRQETQELRRQFSQQIDNSLKIIDSNPAGVAYDKGVIEAINKIRLDLVGYENELRAARDRIFPALAEAVMYGTAGGGALGAFASFLGGLSAAGVVAASALTITGTVLTKAIELWNERRKIMREKGSSVAYLAKVTRLIKN